ncbi:MAG: hypothetical protein IK099_03720 [Clostridia bacterium]|nr:hypothetical protein [Clostridia bacterium]
MRNSKRVLLSLLCFIGIITLLSAVCLGLYYNTETLNIMDSRLRASLAGTLDRLMIGSSHAWNGFMPQVFDEALQCSSYNLSGGVFPMYAKELFLKKELSRNPIQTVYIEISDDTLTRTNASDYSEGDEIAIARLDSWGERFDYMRRFLSLNDCVNVYSRALLRGVQAGLTLLRNKSTMNYADRGFYGKRTEDMRFTPEEAAERYQRDTVPVADYRQENIEQLRSVVQTCRELGAEPVFVVIPVSDSYLWEKAGMDGFRLWLTQFCGEMGCACYDFNLLRDRYALFSDQISYVNYTHMSATGAEAFTSAFARVVLSAERGEDVSPLFYGSYAEALLDSPYRP